MKTLMILLLRAYQVWGAPWLGGHCRFTPSCSNYAIRAIDEHGFLKGTWLSVKRLARCHPLHSGGWDPVPEANQSSGTRHWRISPS